MSDEQKLDRDSEAALTWRANIAKSFAYGDAAVFVASWAYLVYFGAGESDLNVVGLVMAASYAYLATKILGPLSRNWLDTSMGSISLKILLAAATGPIVLGSVSLLVGCAAARVLGGLSHLLDPLLAQILFQGDRILQGFVLAAVLAGLSVWWGIRLRAAQPCLLPSPRRKSNRWFSKALIIFFPSLLVVAVLARPDQLERVRSEHLLGIYLNSALQNGDREKIDRILQFYPQALNWKRNPDSIKP